jgi:aminoglycoside 3-N-acetyltransferase
VSVAVEQLSADPLVFLCPREEGCEECDAARESVQWTTDIVSVPP